MFKIPNVMRYLNTYLGGWEFLLNNARKLMACLVIEDWMVAISVNLKLYQKMPQGQKTPLASEEKIKLSDTSPCYDQTSG